MERSVLEPVGTGLAFRQMEIADRQVKGMRERAGLALVKNRSVSAVARLVAHVIRDGDEVELPIGAEGPKILYVFGERALTGISTLLAGVEGVPASVTPLGGNCSDAGTTVGRGVVEGHLFS